MLGQVGCLFVMLGERRRCVVNGDVKMKMAHESRGSRKYVPPRHAGRGGGRRTGRGRRIHAFLVIELHTVNTTPSSRHVTLCLPTLSLILAKMD